MKEEEEEKLEKTAIFLMSLFLVAHIQLLLALLAVESNLHELYFLMGG